MKRKEIVHVFRIAGMFLLSMTILFSAGLGEKTAAVHAASSVIKFVPSIDASVKTKAKKAGVKSTASSKIAVVKVINYTNVYSKPNEKGSLKGRLYRGSAVYVIKKSVKFSYISSGSLKGWAKNSCLVTGSAAKTFAEGLVPRVATVTASSLNVRDDASESASILGAVPRGTQIIVLGTSGDWVKVRITNLVTGFVHKDYVNIESGLYSGVTCSQEKKMESYLAGGNSDKPDGKENSGTGLDPSSYAWDGPVLTRRGGVNQGPSGKETYYNLNMSGVVSIMRDLGNTDEYWVREDGCKMLGDYIMIAANLSLRPRGTLVPTSLGMGIVCDTGTFAYSNETQIDIAVNW